MRRLPGCGPGWSRGGRGARRCADAVVGRRIFHTLDFSARQRADQRCAIRRSDPHRSSPPEESGLKSFRILRHSGWAVLVCLGCAANLVRAGSTVDPAAVDGVVEEWLASSGAPSASIAIVQDGRLTYAKAYGAANAHACHRLRQWLVRKHRLQGAQTARYANSYLHTTLGLLRLQRRPASRACAPA